ncbi:FliM/FliN family flagellar motor switch protein [Sphingomonas psychrotolerans]|uniref:Flagellar motor switch protein FliM n=1 Tax=Sphingomonas psychrotolerans TaxID=1327635 RepID=A0A2K8MNQ5_9SPHN|nr:flagellar motor switch protein FliM [Sphingomonas psychrotolerans]ATY33011.1 flagellar motor switch protein FliM [Sphingomonas psychrotolerans]
MVNAPSDIGSVERRERRRASAEHAPALGSANLNPFGDLVTLQHLSARLAKALKPVFDGVLRADLRCWAEPLAVQRWADYRAERGHCLTAWQPLTMGNARARVQLALDAKLVLEMLDAFFGGDGEAPHPLPIEFTPAAETLVGRLAKMLAAPLEAAWEPLTRVAFRAVEGANLAAFPELAGDDPVIVTRFGIAVGERKPAFVDILYPVAALKPHGAALTVKVHGVPAEVEPEWRSGLTRAVMGVRFPVRSVLAEPVVPLGLLLDLKPGDVIPIDFGPEVPVMVASRRLGTGLVGTANGRAAVRLTQLELSEEDFR